MTAFLMLSFQGSSLDRTSNTLWPPWYPQHWPIYQFTYTWRSNGHRRPQWGLGSTSPQLTPPSGAISHTVFLSFSHIPSPSAKRTRMSQWAPRYLLIATTVVLKIHSLLGGGGSKMGGCYCIILLTGLAQQTTPNSGNKEAHFVQPQPWTCKFLTMLHTSLHSPGSYLYPKPQFYHCLQSHWPCYHLNLSSSFIPDSECVSKSLTFEVRSMTL